MFHIRPEGSMYWPGFNFYPWSERKYSIGFVLVIGDWAWRLRYAPHVRTFYCYTTRRQPEAGVTGY